jgi:HlyD family secretion protein
VVKMPNAALRFRPPDLVASNQVAAVRPTLARNGSGGGSGRGERPMGSPGSGRPRGERQITRTVYLLSTNTSAADAKPILQPVPIKTGISDGIFTEIIDGLSEGMSVVTSSTLPSSTSARPQANPFGGGGPGGMRRF